MVRSAGELVQCIIRAVKQYNATENTELRIRIGPLGREHRVQHVIGVQDQRGLLLILEATVVPDDAG